MKLTIPFPKRPLKLKSVKISAKKIQAIIDKEVAEALQHFNNEESGGWALRKDYLADSVLREILGFDFVDEFNQAFINAGLSVSYRDGGSFVELKDGYKPIFFNERTGKLKVVENTDDTSYVFKYSSAKGWVEVGRL